MTFSLIQMIVCLIFGLLGAVLLFCAVCFVAMSIVLLVIRGLGSWIQTINGVLWGMLMFVISRMFRMASIEVVKIEDRNYLFSLFACVIATIAVIVAIVVGGR